VGYTDNLDGGARQETHTKLQQINVCPVELVQNHFQCYSLILDELPSCFYILKLVISLQSRSIIIHSRLNKTFYINVGKEPQVLK
jgi:hypothetical protein